MTQNVKKWIAIIVVTVSSLGMAQAVFAQYNPYYKPLRSGSYIQDKTYYLLTCFNQLQDVKKIMLNDPELKKIYKSKMAAAASIRKRIDEAENKGVLKHLDVDVFRKLNISTSGVAKDLEFSNEQITRIGALLENYARHNKSVDQLIDNHLRPSGKFELYADNKDPELLRKAWGLTAKGINHAIDVYALGKGTEYAYIDSVSFKVHSEFYQVLLSTLEMEIGDKSNNQQLFFGPSLKFVLGLLKINHRNEAARFEPLAMGENYKAYEHIPQISWKDYPYSVILIPGEGTTSYRQEMNPMGKLRCELAARRFKEGKAPLIIVSGGFVHPIQTSHNESYEMKKYLMTKLSIPEDAIIMEPFARHTTTNFRNAVRLMFSYNIPANKKALVVTTAAQSYYITNMGLAARCKRDLGYVPYMSMKRLTANDVEFLPNIDAMQSDPSQPLDP